MEEHREEIVLSGEWLYDGVVPVPVHIVRMNYDFWYQIAKEDDQLEPDEEPSLNSEGHRYYLLFRDKPGPPWWPDEVGGFSVAEAKQRAEEKLPSSIHWHHERQ